MKREYLNHVKFLGGLDPFYEIFFFQTWNKIIFDRSQCHSRLIRGGDMFVAGKEFIRQAFGLNDRDVLSDFVKFGQLQRLYASVLI